MWGSPDTWFKVAEIWVVHPLPAGAAVVFGMVSGFLLSRLRHQGVIEALKERIGQKDDLIGLKDTTIQERSARIDRLENLLAESQKRPAMLERFTDSPPTSNHWQSKRSKDSDESRFSNINKEILAKDDARIRSVFAP